ncbi:MAG: HU family DNA-binding protein [Duncaniella sp.]|nr:HU family DNA-binding protein [Duncaniella sp.]
MDHKQLISSIAERMGLNAATVNTLLGSLTDIIGENCADLNSIAVPGFGTFSAEKTDEYVVTAPDGSRTLMPPAITVKFSPSIILRKKL